MGRTDIVELPHEGFLRSFVIFLAAIFYLGLGRMHFEIVLWPQGGNFIRARIDFVMIVAEPVETVQ
jgi:hypothetical protein